MPKLCKHRRLRVVSPQSDTATPLPCPAPPQVHSHTSVATTALTTYREKITSAMAYLIWDHLDQIYQKSKKVSLVADLTAGDTDLAVPSQIGHEG